MSPFLGEAFFIGIKEGAKILLCVFLALSFFRKNNLRFLSRPLLGAVLLVFFASLIGFSVPVTVEAKNIIVRLIGYVFGLFYFFSLVALFHTSDDILGPLARLFDKRSFLMLLVFLGTVLYAVPDMAGSSLYTADLYSMAGRSMMVFAAAGAGFALSLAAGYFTSRLVPTNMRFLDLPQLLLLLALIKLAAGGVRGFAELSLIPSIQAGLMKLVHDIVHQALVLVLVPDHPILSVTTWNFIGTLFGETAGLWLSLILIVLPPAVFIKKYFSQPIEVPSEIASRPQRRLFIKSIRDERFVKSVPVLLFILFIVGTWFMQASEAAMPLSVPEAKAIAAEEGSVSIPLKGPAEDLFDGTLHRFIVTTGAENMRVLIIKRTDGTLAVCLDACAICPPDGYGQRRQHLVCLSCNTPIPIDTVGKPGGCNPIPLSALVTERDVRIRISELTEKWKMVKSGKTRENMK